MIRPRRLIEATLYLKGGQCIQFWCTEIKVKYSNTNELTGLTVEGCRGSNGLYTRLDDICAITTGKPHWRICS